MTPTKKEFIECATESNVVPVCVELLADMETPVSVFSRLESFENCFLFESAEGFENWGRFSFIGCNPKATFSLSGKKSKLVFSDGRVVESTSEDGLNPLAPLREYLAGRKVAPSENLPRFVGGAVGYFGYECAMMFENLPPPKGESKWDDAHLSLYDDIIIFDNLRHTAKIVACAHIDEFTSSEDAYESAVSRIKKLVEIFKSPRKPRRESKAPAAQLKLKPNMSREVFCQTVEKAKSLIKSGECIQIVPSQKFSTKANIDPISAYRILRLINPSPYMFCLKMGSRHLVGSSPETLLRFAGGKAELRPIAGTRRRGGDEVQDMRLADDLLSDEKERAEHLMLVDLGRNDLSRFCEAGSVQVNDFMHVERYSHLMHLVSHVSGEVKEGVDAFEALAAVFPAGTLSGAPKIRAMQIINQLEPERRGPYGGAVGYVAYGGNMDLAICIRTLQISEDGASVQAGAGIVFDSNAESEFEETRLKARAIEKAIEASLDIDSLDLKQMKEERK